VSYPNTATNSKIRSGNKMANHSNQNKSFYQQSTRQVKPIDKIVVEN